VNVSEVAALFTGIAAIITSLTGAGALVWAVTRGSPREREIAARTAVQKVLDTPNGDDDGDLPDALKRLAEELRRQREEGE
jgi:hypothetical protein